MKIVVDASAILAILFDEPDARLFLSKLIGGITKATMSPVNWWEVQVRVRTKYGPEGEARSEALMADLGVTVGSVGVEEARIAVEAFARYRGRPAQLNLGDCFAYALSKTAKLPLLYKGNDFDHTDVQRA